MPIVWEETYLNRLLRDAEYDAVNRFDYLFFRYSLQTTSGVSIYNLPNSVRKVMRITWKGKKVDPITWQEMAELTPSSFVGGPVTVEAGGGTPRWYSLHPNNIRQIRFYPTPNETIAADDEGIMGPNIRDTVIVSCYRAPILDDTFWSMPVYVRRRTAKAYALTRAFAREGKGQNLGASEYYTAKLEWLYENFRRINEGVYVSKKPRLNAGIQFSSARPGRPQLPANYEVRNPWED